MPTISKNNNEVERRKNIYDVAESAGFYISLIYDKKCVPDKYDDQFFNRCVIFTINWYFTHTHPA